MRLRLARLSELELVCLSLHEDGDIHVIDHLIWGNPGVNPNLPLPRPDFALMNAAQRAVAAFAEFEGEVLNGGLSQYLFNCYGHLGMLLESLPLMEWPEFESEVRGTVAGLDIATINDLAVARDIWDDESELEDRWSAFRTWVDKFNGEAFDVWFYSNQDEYTRRLMRLVWCRRADLITCV